MKLVENGKTITRRNLVTRLEKVQRALGAQAQRADAAERENADLHKALAVAIQRQPEADADVFGHAKRGFEAVKRP